MDSKENLFGAVGAKKLPKASGWQPFRELEDYDYVHSYHCCEDTATTAVRTQLLRVWPKNLLIVVCG